MVGFGERRGVSERATVEARINEGLKAAGLDITYRMPAVSDGFATPHVEGASAPFSWVVAERGTEIARHDGQTADDIVLRALDMLLRDHVVGLEARTRGKGPYSRGTWMQAHAELMGRIDAGWGAQVAARYDEILQDAPLSAEEAAATRRLKLPDGGA